MIKEEVSTRRSIDCSHPVSLKGTDRSGLKQYFENAWDIYEVLFGAIKEDSTYYLAPDPLRNPLIFYYGHTAAFYVNKLVMAGLLKEGVNPRFEVLFAKGVDPALPEHLQKDMVWPAVDEVREYRKAVYDLVLQVIDTMDIPEQTLSTHPIWALHMGIEHDRIHFETSSVLIRQLDVDLVERPAGWKYAPTFGFSEEFELVQVEGGTVILGKQEPAHLFGWDNEFGQLTVEIQPFAATKRMITNGEFIHFVKSGGYSNELYWSEGALEWKARTNTNLPKFWVQDGEQFKYRAMFDVIDMPLDWPVEVNAYEAKAYCKFKGPEFRLMSEGEYKLLTSRLYPDVEPALSEQFNLNILFGSPSPVGYLEPDGGEPFNDLYGNVWEWLSDDFYPLPGFEAHAYYTDFSSPYFDPDHRMMLGGAWATSGTGASQHYRLWFRDYFYQHAGFRLAKNGTT